MQSLVMARLAGLQAGPVALQEDPLRKLMEAVMLGYGEAETTRRADHGHDHGHAHDGNDGVAHSHSHSH